MDDEALVNGQPPEDDEERPSLLYSLLEWVVIIALALGIIWFGRTFVIEPFEVPTGSMLETIQLHNRLFAEKVSYYFRDPSQGEIVFFASPEDNKTVLVKRVIATAGQEVDLRDGIVYVDGEALSEGEYTGGMRSDPIPRHAPNLTADVAYPFTVPDGCVWVMGDNRQNSLDSRYFGPVPRGNVKAHALCIYWPITEFRFV